MINKKLNVGLFGFGCVGQGLYDVLNHSQGTEAKIEKICVKDRNKKRTIPLSNFTFDKQDILNKDTLDVVVELIDNADDALEIVSAALKKGINVVTANKKLLAENFQTLYDLQSSNGAALIYEGACGGSIPVIRNLEEYYDNELLTSLRGILNGSSNYILSKMELDKLDYAAALKEAQEKGFAETDPWLDVAGFDAKYKLCLLLVHAFGLIQKPEELLNLGIQNVSTFDLEYARNRNCRIKSVVNAVKAGNKLRAYIMPRFVHRKDALYNIMYEYNAVEVEGAFSDRQLFVGKGAGSHPTGSAVFSDISALSYKYRYGYKKLKKNLLNGKTNNEAVRKLDKNFAVKVYVRYNDRKELKPLDIISIEEEYTSKDLHYIIANIKFASLYSLMNDRQQKLFICEAGE